MTRPLEQLHQQAVELGAVVCLTSTRDMRLPGGGRRAYSSRPGAQLRSLVVVRPHPCVEHGRWASLSRGVIIGVATLAEGSLDDAATALVNAIEDAKAA